MITRFTNIINGLEALGNTYKKSGNWHTKVTTIQEAKDLTKLPIRSIWQRSYKRVKTKEEEHSSQSYNQGRRRC
ncbi:hypothetical protein AAG906_017026 [Vitis piasezkii]